MPDVAVGPEAEGIGTEGECEEGKDTELPEEEGLVEERLGGSC